MKRFRGRKRYYRDIQKKINEFVPHHETDSWYNLWHWHFDNRGKSLIIKERRTHFKYYIKLLERIMEAEMSRSKDFQTWILIDQDTPSCDALFIHTENPHSEFPIKFALNWEENIPNWMSGLINPKEYNIGKGVREDDGSIYFIIYKHGLGIPLS